MIAASAAPTMAAPRHQSKKELFCRGRGLLARGEDAHAPGSNAVRHLDLREGDHNEEHVRRHARADEGP